MISFAKLRNGSWGLRSDSAISGDVTVIKKDGSEKTATVGREVWSGNGVYLYAIAVDRDNARDDDAPRRRHLDDRDGDRADAEACGREDRMWSWACAYGDNVDDDDDDDDDDDRDLDDPDTLASRTLRWRSQILR